MMTCLTLFTGIQLNVLKINNCKQFFQDGYFTILVLLYKPGRGVSSLAINPSCSFTLTPTCPRFTLTYVISHCLEFCNQHPSSPFLRPVTALSPCSISISLSSLCFCTSATFSVISVLQKNHAGSKIQLLFIVLQEIHSYAAFQCSRDVTYRFKGNHGIVFPCLHPSSPSLIFISSLPWNSLHPHFFL